MYPMISVLRSSISIHAHAVGASSCFVKFFSSASCLIIPWREEIEHTPYINRAKQVSHFTFTQQRGRCKYPAVRSSNTKRMCAAATSVAYESGSCKFDTSTSIDDRSFLRSSKSISGQGQRRISSQVRQAMPGTFISDRKDACRSRVALCL